MRWMGLVLLASAMVLPAATPVTVEGLAGFLAAESVAHKKDGAVAGQLATMVPGERLSEEKLQTLAAQFSPGRKTARMLELLADRAAFLALPPNEIPRRPAPDHATLQKLWDGLERAAEQTSHRLPDFMATREIRGSDNLPDAPGGGFALRPRTHYTQKITYRDGRDAPDVSEKKSPHIYGLVSSGEFGGLLLKVFFDIPSGTVRWSHWEHHADGEQMVLRYEVPASGSHFRVNFFCCSFTMGEAHNFYFSAYDATPAYHGEIAVDAASGELRRLTVEGDYRPEDSLRQGGIAIDYRPVVIGGRSYVCPVHSVALLQVKARQYMDRESSDAELLWINEARFVDYHRLGSEVRIVSE